MKKKITCILIFINSIILAQNIIIDDQRTAQDLVLNELFNNAACVNVTNITITGGNFGTAENSFGYFNGNGSSFLYEEGIVLSTGKANNAVGPNNFISSDGDPSWGPDTNATGTSDLEDVLGVSGTLNATVLEFDFIPDSNFISFEYIFASEAYRNDPRTCVLSDEFAFLIKPVGFGTYRNIALVPDTNTRISILTVHPTIFSNSGISCIAENEEYFDHFNDIDAPINYNGQTVSLTAQTQVVAGQEYHLKIVIADDDDPFLDSAVFFKKAGFNFSGLDLGPDLLISNNNALCPGEFITLDAGIASEYHWSKNGVPITAGQLFTVNSPGFYEVIVGDIICGILGDINIEYDIFPNVSDTTLTECTTENVTNATFNLNETFDAITNNDSSLIIVGFYLLEEDAVNPTNAIALENPESFANTILNQEVFARVINSSGCASIAKITLLNGTLPNVEDDEFLTYCLNEFPNKIILNSGLLETNPNDFTFNWSTGETTQNIEIYQPGTYTVNITRNIDNCFVERVITVEPSNIATFKNVLITDMDNRDRVSIIINVKGSGDYEYALDSNLVFQNSNAFEFLVYGEHRVFIRDKNGCLPITEATFVILDNPNFFTPNNDGVNDFWNINNLNNLHSQFNTISKITIFNRYGKVMTVIDPFGLGWNGNFKGKLAPPDDYWYSLNLINFKGEVILKQGHFSLSR